MSWSTLDQDKIGMKAAGRKQYVLEMTSNLSLGNVIIDSKILYQWDLFLHKTDNGLYHITLLTLEHSLLNANNPAMADIFMATKTMMDMFRELQLICDASGNIKDILNTNDIYERYLRLKVQPISFSGGVSMRAEQVYNIPEQEVKDKNTLIKMVQAMEFFETFFSGLQDTPGMSSFRKKRMNSLRNLEYTLSLKATGAYADGGKSKVYHISGNNETLPDAAIQKAFGEMPFVAGQALTFNASYANQLTLETESGWPVSSIIKIEEYVCPVLKATIVYQLKSVD